MLVEKKWCGGNVRNVAEKHVAHDESEMIRFIRLFYISPDFARLVKWGADRGGNDCEDDIIRSHFIPISHERGYGWWIAGAAWYKGHE